MNSCKAGLYIRLSREDDGDSVSESIVNQKSLLEQYVMENNLDVFDIYIDDGYSGTNFDRPGFCRMINDIENGKIGIIITKDMSRLGRDYIGTGNLIEKYFPEHNIRYIAVCDGIDTFLDNSNNEIAPFKAIMNDMYARDISKKIKSSLRAKMKEGKWVGCRAPFGYMKDLNDKNHLVINTKQAMVVKRIFKMAASGLSSFKIARKLSDEGEKTPSWYYQFKWNKNYDCSYNWNAKTIKDILTNRVYVGDMVQNKRNKINYKIKKVKYNEKSDYIIVENTHEAIVNRELFTLVQKMLPVNVYKCSKKEIHLLDGLLYCGDCGHRISILVRRKDNRRYTICNYYRTYIKKKVCTTHSNNYDTLEREIVLSLINICRERIDIDKIKKGILARVDNELKKNNKTSDSNKISKEIEKLKNNLDCIYMDKLNGVVDNELFIRIKKRLEGDLFSLNQRKKKLEKSDNLKNLKIDKYDDFVSNYLDRIFNNNDLSWEMIVNLIEKVNVFDDKSINVKVRF